MGLGLLALLLGIATAAPEPEVLREWVGEATAIVVPLLEEVTGRRLEDPPPVRYVPLAVLIASERERALPYFLEANPDAPREQVEQAVDAYVRATAKYVAAYDYERRLLYVVHENLVSALDFAPLPTESASRAAAWCVVAHELTHALQAQEVGDPPWFGTDGALPASVVREGHAIEVGAEVCRRLGERSAAAWHLLIQGALGVRDEAERDLVYRQGARLVRRATDAGGPDAAWALIATPPPVEDVSRTIEAEEAAWAKQGERVERLARPFGACLVRREWRPEELRVVRPKVLAPPQEAIADVRWLSWCGIERTVVLGHGIVEPERGRAVMDLVRVRFGLGGDTVEDVAVRGADDAARWCGDDGCVLFVRSGERLAVVGVDVDLRRAVRIGRRLLR